MYVYDVINKVFDIVQDRSFLMPQLWKGYTPVVYGYLVRTTGGEYYTVTTSGVTGATEPTWPGAGTVNDNGVVWTYVGGVGDSIGLQFIGFINKAINDIARRVLLPALEKSDTVDTVADTQYTALPSDFMHTRYYKSLRRAYHTEQYYKLKIYPSLDILLRYHSRPDVTGAVRDVAVSGSNLHYLPIPSSAETLRLHYQAKPTTLTAIDDEITEIPDSHVEDLLVNYCASECYKRIEDGTDGQKINYQSYRTEYEAALIDLIQYLGPFAFEPIDIMDELNFDLHANTEW